LKGVRHFLKSRAFFGSINSLRKKKIVFLRNAERILWEVRERQINQANAEKKKKQEENERVKKIILVDFFSLDINSSLSI